MLLTPQTPGDEFGGYAEAKLGDYNLYHFEGAVDLPASDTLKFRLAGRSSRPRRLPEQRCGQCVARRRQVLGTRIPTACG